VLGEFAEYGEDVLVPLAWIEAAMERHRQPTAVPGDEDVDVAYGVDPAERGSDQTAIVKMVGNRVEWIRYQQYDDPMRTAGRVAAELGEDTTTPVGVDSIGIGAGVLARLRELGYNTVDVRVSESTKRKDATGEMTFKNLRALVLWSVRERLNPNAEDDYGFEPISIPQDDKLTSDLTATKFEPNSAGQIVMRSKKDIRKETGRSPDALDGLAIALYAQQYRERVWVGSMAV